MRNHYEEKNLEYLRDIARELEKIKSCLEGMLTTKQPTVATIVPTPPQITDFNEMKKKEIK